jgi:hypothetical protein
MPQIDNPSSKGWMSLQPALGGGGEDVKSLDTKHYSGHNETEDVLALRCSNDVEMSQGLWWVDASSRRRAQSKRSYLQTNLLYTGKLPI